MIRAVHENDLERRNGQSKSLHPDRALGRENFAEFGLLGRLALALI